MRSFYVPRAILLTVAATVVVLAAAMSAQLVLAQSAAEDSTAASLPNLEARLSELRDQSAAQTPPAVQLVFDAQLEALKQSQILESALKIGDTVAPFALPDATGDTVFSERLLARGPLVIVFYRGGWCPYCNLTLQALQMSLPQIHEAGAQLVAISPESPELEARTVSATQISFPVLSDSGLQVARQFGIAYELTPELDSLVRQFGLDIAERNRTDKPSLPLGVTYIVDRTGVIRYAWLSEDYTHRAEPADILAELEKLSK